MIEKGMGRTRMGRFAAIAVPATVATGFMGAAMLNGMVGAVLSSENGFLLDTGNITTDSVELTAGALNGGTDVAGASTAVLYAETAASVADDHLYIDTASIGLPFGIGDVHLQICSDLGAGTVDLGDVALNAKSLDTAGGADLSTLTVGAATSDDDVFDWDASAPSMDANGFGLKAAGGGTLRDVSAHSYAVTLGSLDVSNMSISLVPTEFDPASDSTGC